MDKTKLEKYKKILLEQKTKILSGGHLRSSEDLHISQDDLAEEGDLANSVINQQISFNIRHRELVKLRLIEEALDRIETGTYGYCEECEEKISEKRLSTQPWTTLCITHAEERERELHGVARIA
ncbi:MAG: TraR/DksA family transcriptional regulator [Bacteriovoracaceae bacterium]|nr:TraR/DksA family transcriptional regulator [Bacteriovoracaceae bacterium]